MVEISKYKQSPAAPSDEASRTGTLNTFQQEYAKSVIPRWKKRNRGYKPLMNMLTEVRVNCWFVDKFRNTFRNCYGDWFLACVCCVLAVVTPGVWYPLARTRSATDPL